ncbi:RNA-directed DNA polymerase, eukaryota, reverse transcriptase zinc-binding domain protein [Tanacetum coccineum]|uniref:RNA-directed DNA polymerase, eukaryota, reverse transcriptase zinc-binding domain protein n=1 Tax=Tanacetum coccineum TaxID=301880 RepID=A0ABQ4ZZA0_9ASTR
MSNMYTICRNEGFSDLKIHHIGGYSIWIQFPSSSAGFKFQENENLKELYSVKRAPSSNFTVDELEMNNELFEATVQEIGSWYIKIIDDYIDLSSNDNIKDVDTSSESIDDHLVDDLEYIQTNLNNIDNQPPKEEANYNESNPKCKAESSDLSRPPGFEFIKKSSSPSSKCSTSFARFRKKDIKGVSLIHELNQIIDVGNSLGYDVRGCKRTLNKMINGIGIHVYGSGKLEKCSGRLLHGEYLWSEVFKLALWNRLQDFMHHRNGSYIMFEDMNAVRNEQERVGSIFNNIEADYFNSFIDDSGSVDLPIRGRCFTWMNKAGTKVSKLDRFLISEDVIDLHLDIRITALDRIWSDYNPILLRVDKIDFGPFPFKLYNSWLLRDGFDNLIKFEWDSVDYNNSKFPIKCHEKFRILKAKKIDEGSASPSDTENRLNLLHELEIIDKFALMDLIQKARVKWDIEGDENTKVFHGLINQKRQNQMIYGVMVDGNWITDPNLIKDAFFQFYKVKFQAQDSYVSFPNLPHSQTPNSMDRDYHERLDIIKKYLHDFINSFFALCDMPYGANSSFFTLILKVNNPTLITDFRPILLALRIYTRSLPNDVIITTGWNARDLENIIRVLHVFYLASGLMINIHKSNIYVIKVNEDEVYNIASNAGCIACNILFNYLGLPISSNMKSIASRKMLIDRFRSRL